jgi:hypothetical protein
VAWRPSTITLFVAPAHLALKNLVSVRIRIQSFDLFFNQKLQLFFYLQANIKDLKTKGEGRRKEHPALQNMKFHHFFQFLRVLFSRRDPHSQCRSRSRSSRLKSMRIRIHNTEKIKWKYKSQIINDDLCLCSTVITWLFFGIHGKYICSPCSLTPNPRVHSF